MPSHVSSHLHICPHHHVVVLTLRVRRSCHIANENLRNHCCWIFFFPSLLLVFLVSIIVAGFSFSSFHRCCWVVFFGHFSIVIPCCFSIFHRCWLLCFFHFPSLLLVFFFRLLFVGALCNSWLFPRTTVLQCVFFTFHRVAVGFLVIGVRGCIVLPPRRGPPSLLPSCPRPLPSCAPSLCAQTPPSHTLLPQSPPPFFRPP